MSMPRYNECNDTDVWLNFDLLIMTVEVYICICDDMSAVYLCELIIIVYISV